VRGGSGGTEERIKAGVAPTASLNGSCCIFLKIRALPFCHPRRGREFPGEMSFYSRPTRRWQVGSSSAEATSLRRAGRWVPFHFFSTTGIATVAPTRRHALQVSGHSVSERQRARESLRAHSSSPSPRGVATYNNLMSRTNDSEPSSGSEDILLFLLPRGCGFPQSTTSRHDYSLSLSLSLSRARARALSL
jgi:hypothetical protein